MADMIDLYELLLGSPGDSKSQARMMAKNLRSQRDTEALSALGSSDPVGALGSVTAKNSSMDQRDLMAGLSRRAQYGEERNARLSQMAHEAQLAKYQQAAMQANAGLQGKDLVGAYSLLRQDLENQGRQGVADTKAAAGPVVKPKTYSAGEVKTLTDAGQEIKNIRRLRQTFDPKFANASLLGTPKRALASTMGSLGTGGQQKMASWWADFDNSWALLKKHKLFGSAFTNTESRAWQAANMVKPGASTEQVEKAFQIMQEEMESILSAHTGGRIAENYGEEATRKYTGGEGMADDPEVDAIMKSLNVGN